MNKESERRSRNKTVPAPDGEFSGKLLKELRERISGLENDLKAARIEVKKYERRLSKSSDSLSKRRRKLQDKVQLRDRQLSEKIKRLSILYEVGQAMSATLDLKNLLDLIVKLAARHLKARKASLMLIDEDRKMMKINSSVGLRKWIVERTEIRVGQGITGRTAATGKAILAEDIATDERFRRPSKSTYQTGSFISVPLMRQEKVLGVLNVSDKRSMEPFDLDDFKLVTTLAAQAAISVENATLYNSLREKITTLEELSRTRETERMQLLTLINSITDGILAVDLAGWPLFINEKARKYLDLGEGPIKDKQIRDVLGSGNFGRLILEGIESAMSAMITRRETSVEDGRGGRKHFEIISIPAKEGNGRQTAILNVIRDITDIKELDQIRCDFLNRASHQLKTPVGLIKGFADTLVNHPELDEEQRVNFLKLVHSEADRLTVLIENFLDFTQVDSGILRIEMEVVGINAFIEQIMPSVGPKASEKGIELKTSLAESLPDVETDRRCLLEIFRNILDNSLKFTPRGGYIGISTRRLDDVVVMTISDTGPGIGETDLPHIFEKYYVGESGKTSGTGLGLYIAKEMMNSMGGAISVTSQPGEGTMVMITLPLAVSGEKE